MRCLGVFVKQPEPGTVKTRLAETLGRDAAADLYRCFQADLIERFSTIADRRILAYAPRTPAAAGFFAEFIETFVGPSAETYELWPQPEGHLGKRMIAWFEHSLRNRSDRAVLIGSDSPTLPSGMIQRAFDVLLHHDCVLAPALDGGYCLIGLRRELPELFSGIAWSTGHVLQQTLERLEQGGGSWCLLEPWYDVDVPADLRMLMAHRRALRAAGESDPCPRTASWLARHAVRGTPFSIVPESTLEPLP